MTAVSTTRVAGLARANTTLMVRNRLTLSYAVIFPLLPMGFLLIGDGPAEASGAQTVTSCLTLAWLFPVFYNLLSMVVTRRDELVLKRLRTGETRDGELILAMALPGSAIAVVISVALVGIGVALGLPFPVNPLLYLLTVLLGTAVFAALALWTAAWTPTAEAAQLTSLPVCLLAVIGQFSAVMPHGVGRVLELTPGGAFPTLVEVTWFADEASLGLAETWSAAAGPLLVLVAWAVGAVWLGLRSMRWEPRH